MAWVLATAALLLALGNHYYDAKSRALRAKLDGMGQERLYLEAVTRDFQRVLEDVATSASSNGSLKLMLQRSGFELKLTSAGSVPAPVGNP